MSTPIVWIIIPGVIASGLYMIHRWKRLTVIVGCCATILLAWLAWVLPMGENFTLGPWSIPISDTLWILGRRLILTSADRPILVLIYSTAAFWFGGVLVTNVGSLFVPAGLGIVALLTASFAVEPFLYAALFIEMAVLLCIPLLSPSQRPAGRGVIRFLSFQTLGVPFILFTSWLVTESSSEPNQVSVVINAAILASLGFSFLLAVFPFHSWMPMLAEESHPYAAAFVFYMLTGMVFLFAIKFFENVDWLGESSTILALFRLAGMIMIATGGLWTAFQQHLGRMLAYALMFEIGLSFLVIQYQWSSLSIQQNEPFLTSFYFPVFLSRGLILGIWALALSVFYAYHPDIQFRSIRGIGRRFPIATSALVLANLSMAGFPLLAGFPIRLTIIDAFASVDPIVAMWILFGTIGLVIGALRTLAALVIGGDGEPWKINENLSARYLLFIGVVLLFLAGIFTSV